MPIEVTMGAISPTMESGQIVEWRVKVGDKVSEGDSIADVQTDKAVMPLEAFDEGVVAVLVAAIGQDIKVGKPVLVLAKKGEDFKSVAASYGSGAAASAPAASAPAAAAPKAEATNGQEVHTPAPAVAVAGGRVKSSPLARKVAASGNVDIAQVPGSGPGGRVIRSDVESFLASGGGASSAPASKSAAPSAPSKPSSEPRRSPHTPMRKTIAARMIQAKQEAPEIHVAVDIVIDQIVAIRERLNKQLAPEKIKLSVGDFVTKAVALALRKHPGVNATFEPDAIVEHGDVNVGIAVALEGGLIVPVLHRADTLGLKEIRLGSDALVDAARKNKLTGNQLKGGTFTISNLGMYGVKSFDAILNLPQVGILAVGAGEKRPIVVGDTLQIGTVMTVNLTADHRAVDGALAAEFLRTLKGYLEEPTSMLL